MLYVIPFEQTGLVHILNSSITRQSIKLHTMSLLINYSNSGKFQI